MEYSISMVCVFTLSHDYMAILIRISTDLTGLVAMAVVCVAFGSAVITGDFKDIEEEFGVSEVVTALSVSLMVVGFGCVVFYLLRSAFTDSL